MILSLLLFNISYISLFVFTQNLKHCLSSFHIHYFMLIHDTNQARVYLHLEGCKGQPEMLSLM